MFKKETSHKKYHENPYLAANFQSDQSENLRLTDRNFASNPSSMSTSINMTEPKNFMNVNPVRAAIILIFC